MKVTELAINNRAAIIILTLLLVAVGFYSYITIPKESNPSIEIPIFVVTTVYPGIGPEDMETLVTNPIEQELQGIEGVDEITSTTREGVSNITVEFGVDVELNEASQRVREQVDLARPELPDDIEEPIINDIDVDDFPIMRVNLAGDYSMARLTGVAEDLQDELEAIAQVREVELLGGLEREVQVNANLDAMLSHNLAFDQLIGAIQGQNITIPAGTVDVDRLEYLLRVSGEFGHPAEIEDLVVHSSFGAENEPRGRNMIYMRDVAEVIFGFKDRESFSRLSMLQEENDRGELVKLPHDQVEENEVVTLNVLMRSGANILETAEEVRETLSQFPFPGGSELAITGDQSEMVESLISDLENSIISGMIFVILVLVFFLGVRNALLVGTAVPLSMLVGFIVLNAMGYTVNFVILFSLIIALGLLVDNSVVVVENIYRYLEMGYERFEAARLATSEVGYALLASTSTLIAAFLPLLFWPGIIGQFMGYLPMTLIIVLACSFFVAVVIYPVLSAFVAKVEGEEKKPMRPWVKRLIMAVLFLFAVMIGLSNPIILGVTLAVAAGGYLLYRLVIRRAAEHFSTRTLPRFVESYKWFLRWMLSKDYSRRYALLRNSFTMLCFSLGLLFLVLGGLFYLLLGQPALMLLVPGAIGLGLGVLGITVHTAESIFLGGSASFKLGGVFLLFMATCIALLQWAGHQLAPYTMGVMLIIPALVTLLGMLGMLRRSGNPLILTDNRARLINTVFGVLFAIVTVYGLAPTGMAFFPETDPDQVQVNLESPIGTNLHASDQSTRRVYSDINRMLQQNPDSRENIENILVNVGTSPGMGPGPVGGGMPSAENAQIALNMIDFEDRSERSTTTLQKLRESISDLPDVIMQIEAQEMGPPTGPPVNIEVSGPNFDEIVRMTREINNMLSEAVEVGQIEGLVDLRDNVGGGLPEYRIHVDHEEANRRGVNLSQVGQTIRTAMEGMEAGKYRDGEDEYDIVVQLEEQDRRDLSSLRNLNVHTGSAQIPLVQLAEFEEDDGLASITRIDMERTATLEGYAAPGFSGSEVLGQVQDHLSEYRSQMPAGYELEYTGEAEDQAESFEYLSFALFLSIALIFLIMVAKFNTVAVPLIIIIAVALSLIGVLLGLIVTRTEFGLMTFVGVISLAGIVCINNIVLVDFIRQMLHRGHSKLEAIVEGGAVRLRPVLLTAMTTILGLVPLTFGINVDFIGLFTALDPAFQLGSENSMFWGPMGTAIISGLIFATFLTLVIVPVMYSVFDSLFSRLKR